MLEHLHENEWGVGRGPKLVIRFSMDGACVVSVIFYFIHTNADELKGSVKLQLLKLALHICHHLSARHRNQKYCMEERLSLGWGDSGGYRDGGPHPVRWVTRKHRITELMSYTLP